jgi:prephenate dehydrogenase
MATLSHLPQLVSCALAATVAESADAGELARLAGSGYRDMTRLAASPWGVWRDILATNSAEVADALDALTLRLAAVRDELRQHSRRVCEDPEGARGGDELAAARSLFGHARPD